MYINFEITNKITYMAPVYRGGWYGKNIISRFHDFITILCHVSFYILSEQCSQTNFPYYKDKAFQGYKKRMVDI